ncbi:MAG: cysteine desulfurase family protein [bacterium]|nr:cysteine desulfurase family protein [bacterium]
MKIYFDNAATTPLDKEVFEAMLPILRDDFGNPSSSHSHGRKVKAQLEISRKTIASLLNATPGEIIFTSGGTEADNMALRSSVKSLGVKNIITSPLEHHAVLHTAEELAKKGKIVLHLVKLTENGHIDLNSLEDLLKTNSNVLVSLMHANNEIGNLLDVEKVSALCKTYNALFHCDTVQTMGHYPFDLQKMGIDFAVGAAHKFNGPKGVGFLYVNKRLKLQPILTGGAQERELRGGTENVYGIVGMAKALEICYRDMDKKQAHIKHLKQYIIDKVKAELPEIKFNGDPEGHSLYTVLSLAFPPSVANEMLLFNFDIHGISVSGGSACSSGSNAGSHVIRAINKNLDHAPVRFSFGKYNTIEEADQVLAFVKSMFVKAQA